MTMLASIARCRNGMISRYSGESYHCYARSIDGNSTSTVRTYGHVPTRVNMLRFDRHPPPVVLLQNRPHPLRIFIERFLIENLPDCYHQVCHLTSAFQFILIHCRMHLRSHR